MHSHAALSATAPVQNPTTRLKPLRGTHEQTDGARTVQGSFDPVVYCQLLQLQMKA